MYVALHEVTWLYGVDRTCAKTAAVSQGTSHASAVSTPLWWIFKKTRYKKLVIHIESHVSAVSLLESGEQRYKSNKPRFHTSTQAKQTQAAARPLTSGSLLGPGDGAETEEVATEAAPSRTCTTWPSGISSWCSSLWSRVMHSCGGNGTQAEELGYTETGHGSPSACV